LVLQLAHRMGLGKKAKMLTLLFRTRHPTCRQGITAQAARSEQQQGTAQAGGAIQCLSKQGRAQIPANPPLLSHPLVPGALRLVLTAPRPWPGCGPRPRQKPQGCKALPVQPPGEPCAEGTSGRRINQVDRDYYCNYIIILVYHRHHRY